MKECRKIKKIIPEIINNEAEQNDRILFFNHIKHCSSCRREYEEIKDILLSVKSSGRPEPPEEFWDNYWINFMRRLHSYTRTNNVFPFFRFRINKKQIVKVAAAVALIVTGFFIGKISQNRHLILSDGNRKNNYGSVYLEELSDQFLRKSQIIILEISNSDYSKSSPVNSDFSEIITVSRQLINNANTIRENIDNKSNPRIIKFIEDFEPFLLQIANIDNNKTHILSTIKKGIQQNSMLFKIEIITMGRKSPVYKNFPEINNII